MTDDLPRSSRAQADAASGLPSRRREGGSAAPRGERILINRQRSVAVRPRPLGAFLLRACDLVLPKTAGVAVCFISDAEIARLNAAYRGKPGPTDVLSFRGLKRGGDIAISPAAARRNARSLGRGLEEELRVLILHGVLHLAGYDHETDTGQMDRRERQLRRRLGIG